MKINVDNIINYVLAHSAATYLLTGPDAHAPLNTDHKQLLLNYIGEAFCRVGMSLAPMLADVDIEAFTLEFQVVPPVCAQRQIELAISARVLEALADSAADSVTAARYADMADAAIRHIKHILTGPLPTIRPARY